MEDFLNLLSPSRMRIVQFVKRRGTVTVDQVAEALDLAETTIRQHLDRLERKGLLRHESVVSGPGRPTSEYQLTEAGLQLFPSQDGRLMGRIIQFMIQEGYPKLVDEFFREIWAERQDELTRRFSEAGAETIEEQLEVLEGFLDEQGFLPEVEIDGTRAIIRECNCPFAEGVSATRLPCRLEAQLFEQVLQRKLERVNFMPDGHPACVYEFEIESDSGEPRPAE